MPLLRIVTSTNPEKESQKRLLAELSRFVAENLRKLESYVIRPPELDGVKRGASRTSGRRAVKFAATSSRRPLAARKRPS